MLWSGLGCKKALTVEPSRCSHENRQNLPSEQFWGISACGRTEKVAKPEKLKDSGDIAMKERLEGGKVIRTVETGEELDREMERTEEGVAVDVPRKLWGYLESKWPSAITTMNWEQVRNGSYRRLWVSSQLPRPFYAPREEI